MNATLTERVQRGTTQQSNRDGRVLRGYIPCKAQYDGCLHIVPIKEA